MPGKRALEIGTEFAHLRMDTSERAIIMASKTITGTDDKKPSRGRKLIASIETRLLPAVVLVVLALAGLPLRGEKGKPLDEAWGQLRSAEPHFSRGLKEFNESRYETASAELEKCVREMPRHAFAHYYLANIYYIQGDYQRSLTHMEQSLGQFEFMHELNDYAGKLKAKTMDSYRQMLESEWENSTSCRTSRELEALSHELTAEQSKMELRAERQRDPRTKQKAHYLYFLGNILFQLKRFSEASEKYLEAIALNPRHASAYNNAAAVSYMAGEHRAALTYLERAEEQGLEDNLNLRLKHLVYEALGRPTEGILQEEVSPGAGDDLGVMRLALAFKTGNGTLPPLYENCYIVYDKRSNEAVIIDPGVRDPRIGDFIQVRKLEVTAILNTHGHEDHAGADRYYAGLFGAPVSVHKSDSKSFPAPPERSFRDGETLPGDGFAVKVFHTPGHTPGSVCFLIGGYLFSGDTLFKNDIGNVWTEETGKIKKVRETLVQNIKEKLLGLPGQTRVCPGHGKTSTIADEKANNPFLRK
jgi:hydroxyacylglutathione hydrolase